jgi:DMSO/TMAO reductase YedYZ molybdopterin-dependent catalytic subunit
LRRHQLDGITVIPVIAKACAWKRVKWLADMNVRPKNGRAIWGSGASPDEGLTAIVEEVAAAINAADSGVA